MSKNTRAISDEDKLRSNYAEYLVRRNDGKTLITKIGLVIFTVIAVVAIVILLSGFPWAMLPLCVGTMALCWFLWRFTCLEYEYIIIQATVELHKIYGERSRKKIHEIKTSDIEKVAPVNAHPEVKNGTYVETFDISNGKQGDDLFYIIYNAEKGKGIIYLNVIKKTLDVFKYYKASAVEYGNIE